MSLQTILSRHSQRAAECAFLVYWQLQWGSWRPCIEKKAVLTAWAPNSLLSYLNSKRTALAKCALSFTPQEGAVHTSVASMQTWKQWFTSLKTTVQIMSIAMGLYLMRPGAIVQTILLPVSTLLESYIGLSQHLFQLWLIPIIYLLFLMRINI